MLSDCFVSKQRISLEHLSDASMLTQKFFVCFVFIKLVELTAVHQKVSGPSAVHEIICNHF